MSHPTTRELTARYVIPTYGRFDLEIVRGAGARVWDESGNAYLDFGGGIAVCSLGHAHPRVTAAVAEQAGALVHTSNLYFTAPQAQFAARLASVMPGAGKVFLCNSGAEANEGLIKLARKFGSATGRHEIVTFTGSFHGRTMAGISATGQEKVKVGFAPLLDGFRHVPFGDLAAAREVVGPKTAAILVEPIQGEGGIHCATADFLCGLRELCDERDLLLLFDEVQCGLGRTGDWCAWETVAPGRGIVPDGVSWAKGIANGFPLGSFWARARPVDGGTPLCDLLGPGSHGTTYGGNPVACAAGLAVFDEIESAGLLENVRERGREFRELLEGVGSPLVSEVRGCGLMLGMELVPDFFERIASDSSGGTPALRATRELMAAGLLVVPAGERTIRFLPPLNVGAADLAEAASIVSATLRGWLGA